MIYIMYYYIQLFIIHNKSEELHTSKKIEFINFNKLIELFYVSIYYCSLSFPFNIFISLYPKKVVKK